MLTGLRLGNFKAFGETQNIPIKPLTLIFGANSAGKSSIIHGLLLAHHANQANTLDVHQPILSKDAVDLGGFSLFVHRRDATRIVEIGLNVNVDHVSDLFKQANLQFNSIAAHIGFGIIDEEHKTISTQHVNINMYNVDINSEPFICVGRSANQKLRIIECNYNHPLFLQVLEAITENYQYYEEETDTLIESQETIMGSDQLTQEMLRQSLSNLSQNLTFEAETAFSIRLTKDWNKKREQMSELLFPLGRVNPQFKNEEYININVNENSSPHEEKVARDQVAYHLVRHRLVNLIELALQSLAAIISIEFQRAVYLGPLRSYPPRLLTFTGSRASDLFSNKDDAWRIVGRDATIREAVNAWMGARWLKTPYEFVVRRYTSTDTQAESIEELVLRDKRFNTIVGHRDIGIGISQVLPVLVSAYASENKIIAIEQPEIHLHPALQAELGDVFIKSALGIQKNTFLLETHSEHLILRIMRRMRDTVRGTLPEGVPPVRPADVAILYVDRKDDDSTSVVTELALDEEGQLLDPWPGGFFEESFNERFA